MLDQDRHQTTRLSWSFAASVLVHVLLFVLVGIVYQQRPAHTPPLPRTMDVVMLDSHIKPKKTPPKEARAIANRNAEGGDAKARDRITRAARAPMQAKRARPRPPQTPQRPQPAPPSQQTQPRMTRSSKRQAPKPRKHALSRPASKTAPKVPTLQELMPSTLDLAQMSHRYERERRMRQLNAREADIPINTREAKYAPYAQFLVRALEEQWRPGEADYNKYTEDARRAVIRLTIEKNGDLGGVEILRPSPIPEINESALRAIHAAAPFRPLPRSWGLDRVSFYLTFEVVNDKFIFRTM